jgi:GntR family transcriptional regulator/MocR family aminotransferase
MPSVPSHWYGRRGLYIKDVPVSTFGVYQLFGHRRSGLRRQESAFLLTLPPRDPRGSLRHWLRDAIRASILSRNLQPKQKIPSSRALAAQYSLSRGTVLAALEELKAEGYLTTTLGSGVYVGAILPDSLLQGQVSAQRRAASTSHDLTRISQYAKRVKPIAYNVSSASLAFRTNLPALDLFPTSLWARIAGQQLRSSRARR